MLTALIADDEALARQRLRKLLAPLEDEGQLRVTAEAADGAEVLDKLAATAADVLFLDIQMPELDGFDVIEKLPAGARPEVIFTTAYDRYALRAFEANAIDYLLKPISKPRLREAVARVERLRRQPAKRKEADARLDKLLTWIEDQKGAAPSPGEAQPDDATPGDAPPDEERRYPRQLSISYSDRIRFVPVEQIVSVEIEDGITRLYTLEDGSEADRTAGLRHHVIDHTLDALEETLNPQDFMRVHRSTIVRIGAIREMIPWFSGRYKLVLPEGHEVIASRERAKRLKDRIVL